MNGGQLFYYIKLKNQFKNDECGHIKFMENLQKKRRILIELDA